MKINNKRLVRCVVAVVVLLGALAILQMWFSLFGSDVFGKIMLTLLILGAVATFVIAVKEDLAENDQLKKDKYID